jgi:hypothetical protein
VLVHDPTLPPGLVWSLGRHQILHSLTPLATASGRIVYLSATSADVVLTGDCERRPGPRAGRVTWPSLCRAGSALRRLQVPPAPLGATAEAAVLLRALACSKGTPSATTTPPCQSRPCPAPTREAVPRGGPPPSPRSTRSIPSALRR